MVDFKNGYLFIVYGKSKEDYSQEFSKMQKQAITNAQNNLQQNANSVLSNVSDIAKRIGMTVYTSPIVQNFASKIIPNSVLGRLNSSIYDIMADGKISLTEVADDFIRNTTGVLDNVALDLGFPTVSSLYNAIKPDGTGIFSIDTAGTATTFFKSFSKNSKKQNDTIKKKESEKKAENNEVIRFNLVTDDSEKWQTNTPERKTESGMSLIPILGNDNLEKNFKVYIIDNQKNGSMYNIKNKLFLLRKSRTPFDVYVIDNDVKYNYKLEHCVFTDINTDVEGKNSLVIDISIVQIPEYTVEMANISGISSNKSSSGSNGNVKNKINNKSGINKKNSPNKKTDNSKSFNVPKQQRVDSMNNITTKWYPENQNKIKQLQEDISKSVNPDEISRKQIQIRNLRENNQHLINEYKNRANKGISDPNKKITYTQAYKMVNSGKIIKLGDNKY